MSFSHVSKRIAVLDAMLPNAIKGKYKKLFRLIDDAQVPEDLIQYFKDDMITLERAQQLEIIERLKPYIKDGNIVEDIEVSQKYQKKTFVGVKLNQSNVDEILAQLKTETQIRAIELIHDAGEMTLIELKEEGISNAVVNNLVQKDF